MSDMFLVVKGAMVVATGTKLKTLYLTENNREIVAAIDLVVDSKFLHYRLGHMSGKVDECISIK